MNERSFKLNINHSTRLVNNDFRCEFIIMKPEDRLQVVQRAADKPEANYGPHGLSPFSGVPGADNTVYTIYKKLYC